MNPSSDHKLVVGIDGCRGGWFWIKTDGEAAYFGIAQTRELLTVCEDADLVLIDIPMGLSDTESPRNCDALLRDALGGSYRSSVFSPPVRKAVYADDYPAACDINAEATGKKISKQAWNICGKIREMDQLLIQNSQWMDRFHECHPELLFKMLNGGVPITQKKKTEDGKQQRLELLQSYFVGAGAVYQMGLDEYLRKDLQADDILDAMVLAVYGLKYGLSKSLPEIPPRDSEGIRMAVWY